MVVAIITVAGISSRFNQGIPEDKKILKCIYYEKDRNNTLLKHLLDKCSVTDKIIIVGGYKYKALQEYCIELPPALYAKLQFVYNEHFSDFGSGYSLYLGLQEVFSSLADVSRILFVEGDLDIDRFSFEQIIKSNLNVLTYTTEPIYANKSVVLFKNQDDRYKYAFNSEHGLLKIEDGFSCILNSAQIWQFIDISKLKTASKQFIQKATAGTNLVIIQNYIDMCNQNDFEVLGIQRWTNCNTREDYKKISVYWEAEDERIE